MSEKKKPSAEMAQNNAGHRWQEGHPRYGGRKKRTAQVARALAEEMGVDPLEFMLGLLKSDVIDQTVIENGKPKKVKAVVPLDVRLDAAKTVVNYMYPRLSSTAVTGADDGPVAVATLDIGIILANPELANAAQDLALKIAALERNQYRAEHCLPEPSLIDHPDFQR